MDKRCHPVQAVGFLWHQFRHLPYHRSCISISLFTPRLFSACFTIILALQTARIFHLLKTLSYHQQFTRSLSVWFSTLSLHRISFNFYHLLYFPTLFQSQFQLFYQICFPLSILLTTLFLLIISLPRFYLPQLPHSCSLISVIAPILFASILPRLIVSP